MKSPNHPRPCDRLVRLAAALRAGLLAGTAMLLGPAFAGPQGASIDAPRMVQVAAGKKVDKKAEGRNAGKKSDQKPRKKSAATKEAKAKPGPLADFGQEDAPDDVVHTANWISSTRNNGRKPFVVIDKKMARLYVFDARGRLKSHTPILLGKAVGDESAPGVGDKPLSRIKEEEKTTPAGRFLARPGRNTRGEDIIWIDYAAAISMHRMRKVSEAERRAERMATSDVSDNRISNGCVNVPPDFYDRVLKPAAGKRRVYVYVLPETTTPQQVFGSADVPAGKDKGRKLAKAADAKG